MRTIYMPTGAAKEYGDWALNIYTGCPHRCTYCFAPNVIKKAKENFHGNVMPRTDIVKETERFLKSTQLTGKTIHLCFTCDPYPTGVDSHATRDIILTLKRAGNHVQILTKGDGTRDFDLLDGEDWYGVTVSAFPKDAAAAPQEPGAISPYARMQALAEAKARGIRTWVSFEPVLDWSVLDAIKEYHSIIDRAKIGKLNYHPSEMDWAKFGYAAEALCKELGLDCYIKSGLRAEMDAAPKGV